MYDGNGNVGQMVDGDDGELAASYEYDPFGNLIKADGAYAEVNPFRFSTRYFDIETGLGSWLYRYYIPELGIWLNRDPLNEYGHILLREVSRGLPCQSFDGETGRYTIPNSSQKNGVNLYVYVNGNPLNNFDFTGLYFYSEESLTPDPRPDIDYPQLYLTDDWARKRNTVVCSYGGYPEPYLGDTTPCLEDCQYYHEMIHVKQINLMVPGICQGNRGGMNIGPQNEKVEKMMEWDALTKALECLFKRMDNLPCDDDCAKEIKTYIPKVFKQRNSL